MEPYRYAGFWIRAVARVIDLILLVAALNLFFLGDRMGSNADLWGPGGGFGDGFTGGGFGVESAVRGIFYLFFPAFYYVYLHGAYGQTFGKMVLGIRVLNEDGTPIDYRKSFFRWLGYFLCDLTLNIGYLWAAFDPRKQGLHDKACRTIVVREKT